MGYLPPRHLPSEALEKDREASDKYYDGLIDNLEKEKEAIQEQIDAIRKKNDETDRPIETEKKRKALEDAKNNKTIKVKYCLLLQ